MPPIHAPPRRPAPFALAAALVLAGLPWGLAAADHPVGPELGNNRYKTDIATGPQGTDHDDYTAVLADGDELSFTVKSPFQSPLLPVVQLLDPEGRDRLPEARLLERGGGKKLTVKGFPVDRTGEWAVRVAGRLGTEGTYVVSFKVASPPRQTRDEQRLEGGERGYEVEAVDGSELDVDITWSAASAPVEIVAVEDPGGRAVTTEEGLGAADLAKTRKRRTSLRRMPLSGGDGPYVVRVRAPDGPATFRIRWRVRQPERAKGLRKLDAPEPFLILPQIVPILGVEGRRIRLDCWHLSTGERPRVLFGETPGYDVIVDESGGFLDVTVPPGEDGALVAVTIVNPDDQATRVDDLFFYVPPPTITAVVGRDGQPVVGGRAVGGDFVRIEGENLRVGQLVQFGPGPQIVPVLRDGGLEVTTRAQDAGTVPVIVSDSFEHEAVSEALYEFKEAPQLAASPFLPVVAGTGGSTALLVRGSFFEATDELTFAGEPQEFEWISPSFLRFTPPAREDGLYEIGLRDRFGQTATPVELRLKAPGIIDAVVPVGGPYLAGGEISIHGGSVVEVRGAHFHAADRVRVGGTPAAPGGATTEALTVTPAAGNAGLADVAVTDALLQETVVEDALRLVGYRDKSATRAPTRTTIDDGSAVRGAVGDLDLDGEDDDVVLVSPLSTGTRAVRTRILIGSVNGVLADGTNTRVPSAGSDASGVDDLRAAAVAIGDLDGVDGPDVLVAGPHPAGSTYGEVRWLVNDGYGVFDLSTGVPGSTYAAPVTAVDETGTEHVVLSSRAVRGAPTVLALGDLDGDDDLDVVLGRDAFESRYHGVDPAYVDLGSDPPYVTAADAAAHRIDELRYHPGVRVLVNRVADGAGLVDATAASIPSAGDDGDATPLPAFPARDLALADLDGDDDLDLVVTWDDPTTVTAYGLSNGNGVDAARLATRVLLNDGTGAFDDATDDWMPSGSDPEWYQGTRLALVDLDGDGDADLVLLHASGVSAYQGTPVYTRQALRILRNDHDPDQGTGGFTDISDTALPAVDAANGDNYRGSALLVTDVDGDGALDILVGTTSAPVGTSGQTGPALRLLSGAPDALAFRRNTGFLPPTSTDSGVCDDLLRITGLSPETQPALILLSETVPAKSTGSRLLRVFDWQR